MVTLAILLIGAALWILCAEYYRSRVRDLPVDLQSASQAAVQRENASRAASIGIWRGDLSAELAYTYASLLGNWGRLCLSF